MKSDNEKEYTKDDAYKSLEMVNTWIGNIDTKVSFSLALIGVLAAHIFSFGVPYAIIALWEAEQISGGLILAGIFVLLLYIASLFSVCLFLSALFVRTTKTSKQKSIIFFGTVASIDLSAYKKQLHTLKAEQLLDDIIEQIHTNSKICTKKSKLYNWGMKFLFLSVILWFICIIFNLI